MRVIFLATIVVLFSPMSSLRALEVEFRGATVGIDNKSCRDKVIEEVDSVKAISKAKGGIEWVGGPKLFYFPKGSGSFVVFHQYKNLVDAQTYFAKMIFQKVRNFVGCKITTNSKFLSALKEEAGKKELELFYQIVKEASSLKDTP